MTRRLVVLTAALSLLALLAACSAGEKKPANAADGEGVAPVYRFSGDLALKGYDAVAYFNDGQAIEGSPDISYEWKGAKWQFANEMNRDLFMRDPEAYAPQFGGYCAWAVSHGYTAKGDPQAWKIVDGKLYLNYSKDVQEKWSQDISGYIKKGNENWPQFLVKRPEHKGE
jgi:hypothetical protein